MKYADSVKIDTDEGRYVMVVDDEQKGLITYDIHDCALAFYASVQRELRPYVLESESARTSVPAGWTGILDPEAYDLDDPKHHTYHDRMVGDV